MYVKVVTEFQYQSGKLYAGEYQWTLPEGKLMEGKTLLIAANLEEGREKLWQFIHDEQPSVEPDRVRCQVKLEPVLI